MIEVLLALVGLGLLDALNPATFTTMLVLLPMIRKHWHAAIFVWGTFLTYLLLGIGSYYGINAYVKNFVVEIYIQYTFVFHVVEVLAGTILLTLGMIFSIRRIRSKETGKTRLFAVKSAAPSFLVLLSITSTFSDFPTALPYFGFMGLLFGQHLNFPVIVLLLAIYCLLYVLPILILYFAYAHWQKRLQTLETRIQTIISRISGFVILCFLLIGGGWLLIDGVLRVMPEILP